MTQWSPLTSDKVWSQDTVWSLDTIWSKVSTILRHELGEGAYNSYLAPSSIKAGVSGDPVLVTPTVYARDWFSKHALNRAKEIWTQNDSQCRILDVLARIEYEDIVRACELVPQSLAPDSAAQEPKITTGLISETQPKLCEGSALRTEPVLGANLVASRRINGLQDRLTFDTFVQGRGNQFAYSMSRQLALWQDGPFQLVFFHGPYGYGKTHLLNAIAWEAQMHRPEARIVYLTAEKFTSTFVKALMDRQTQGFKEEVRSSDLLLIDDVHFIGGKTSSQEELFHTLTTLLENGKRVVFTADRAPSHLSEIEARLRSHLSSGLVCALDVADQTLRMGIIERKFAQVSQHLGLSQMPQANVLEYLAQQVPGSIRELEGAVNTLAASAGARLSSLSLDDAMALLQPNLKVAIERRVTVDEIQKMTADYFGLKQTDLLSERRTRSVARPRQVAMWLCKQHTTRSYPDIGRRFGGRDHTTVLHAVKKVESLLQADDQIARDVEALTRKLKSS
jgi:chromosomal replication initiator protein